MPPAVPPPAPRRAALRPAAARWPWRRTAAPWPSSADGDLTLGAVAFCAVVDRLRGADRRRGRNLRRRRGRPAARARARPPTTQPGRSTDDGDAQSALRRLGAAQPGAVTVAVLNGTDVGRLAGEHRTAPGEARLPARARSHNAPDQTHASDDRGVRAAITKVDAQHVAKRSASAAPPVAAGRPRTLTVACPPPGGRCSADVVVTIGQNLASADDSHDH